MAEARRSPPRSAPGSAAPVSATASAATLARGLADAPFVTVLIVNYNGKRYLGACLDSLLGLHYPAWRWEVIVVDNGSADGSAAFLREHYPWVRVIEAGTNLGFAGGNNEGFRHARGDLIALLNNDTVVDPDWLGELVGVMEQSPDVGAAGSKIRLMAEPARLHSAGLTLYRDGRAGDRGFRQLDRGQFDEPAEVFAACGAAVLLRKRMLDDVGPFDERFFMYYEDLDLAWRARLRGWRVWYVPTSVIRHVHCGTSGEWSPFFLFHVERNKVFANLKNGSLRLAVRSVAVFAAKAGLKLLKVVTFVERTPRHRQEAVAFLTAGWSLLRHLPGLLASRVRIRWFDRTVSDRAIDRFLADRPPDDPTR